MTQNKLTPQQVLSFYKEAEKLKTTLRHSWLSDGKRQESVAEHSWMMALLSLLLIPQIKQKLDALKVMKMIVLHDLAEAVTMDLPIWQGTAQKEAKAKSERAAMAKLLGNLDEVTSKELHAVWEEYEMRESPESKFVKVLDTIDVVVQHNCAPINTWDDNDYLWQLSPLQNAFFNFDEYLRKVKDEIDRWSIAKVSEANTLNKLDQAELKKRSK